PEIQCHRTPPAGTSRRVRALLGARQGKRQRPSRTRPCANPTTHHRQRRHRPPPHPLPRQNRQPQSTSRRQSGPFPHLPLQGTRRPLQHLHRHGHRQSRQSHRLRQSHHRLRRDSRRILGG